MTCLDKLTDQELVALLKEGDYMAYTELYQRYFRLLFVHSYKRLRDEEQAKDIVQDFFITLWEKREFIHSIANPAGYFFTAVNNKIVDYFLKKDVQSKYIASFSGFLEVENVKTDYLVRERELMMFIELEIQQLPLKMREVFELSRKEYLTHKEIAEKLSISEKTVDRQISNALLRLRMKLGLFTLILFLLNHR